VLRGLSGTKRESLILKGFLRYSTQYEFDENRTPISLKSLAIPAEVPHGAITIGWITMGQDMRELLSEVAGTSISGRGRVPRYPHSLVWLPAYWLKHPPQRAVAQRLCALALFGHAETA
jgi:hypothetical protein